MTPKDKAEELVDKYRNTIMSFLNDNMKYMNAKQCALIAVDEILNEENDFIQTKWHYNYWEEVKNEINIL